MSQRQLHEAEEGLLRQKSPGRSQTAAARSCGMEARDEPQHRTKVKPRKARRTWVSVPLNATPHIQSWLAGSEDGSGGKQSNLTHGDLPRSLYEGRACEGNDKGSMSLEKSDHLIRAMKPGNAGGAKEVTN
jgi:hypothetical protein